MVSRYSHRLEAWREFVSSLKAKRSEKANRVDEEEGDDGLVSLGEGEQLQKIARLELEIQVAGRDHIWEGDTSAHLVK